MIIGKTRWVQNGVHLILVLLFRSNSLSVDLSTLYPLHSGNNLPGPHIYKFQDHHEHLSLTHSNIYVLNSKLLIPTDNYKLYSY